MKITFIFANFSRNLSPNLALFEWKYCCL